LDVLTLSPGGKVEKIGGGLIREVADNIAIETRLDFDSAR